MDAVVLLFYSHVAAATAGRCVAVWHCVAKFSLIRCAWNVYIANFAKIGILYIMLALPFLHGRRLYYFYRQWQNSKFL